MFAAGWRNAAQIEANKLLTRRHFDTASTTPGQTCCPLPPPRHFKLLVVLGHVSRLAARGLGVRSIGHTLSRDWRAFPQGLLQGRIWRALFLAKPDGPTTLRHTRAPGPDLGNVRLRSGNGRTTPEAFKIGRVSSHFSFWCSNPQVFTPNWEETSRLSYAGRKVHGIRVLRGLASLPSGRLRTPEEIWSYPSREGFNGKPTTVSDEIDRPAKDRAGA